MKNLIYATIACLSVAGMTAQTVYAQNCGDVTELPGGTVLADGTMAGEKEAMTYFKEKDPELYKSLADMKKEELRKNFGSCFMWYQRGDGCRSGQKQEIILRLRLALHLSEARPDNPDECERWEFPAGTVLEYGKVAGEDEALAYFKEDEPELYKRLAALEKAELRKDFGKSFMWFQNVGNCRTRQKKEEIIRLKSIFNLTR
jgi:hypothetical protein